MILFVIGIYTIASFYKFILFNINRDFEQYNYGLTKRNDLKYSYYKKVYCTN